MCYYLNVQFQGQRLIKYFKCGKRHTKKIDGNLQPVWINIPQERVYRRKDPKFKILVGLYDAARYQKEWNPQLQSAKATKLPQPTSDFICMKHGLTSTMCHAL